MTTILVGLALIASFIVGYLRGAKAERDDVNKLLQQSNRRKQSSR